ncbi:MAG: redoxin domain-containing protein, partial [Candidatus Hermodarchaeota archaeon]|nr:redoxin domain-containing protein [Candidatus Hermodarchaeota archaeon]
MPELGHPAPVFTGVTDDDSEIHLDELKGNIVVLFFYPRAHTPG